MSPGNSSIDMERDSLEKLKKISLFQSLKSDEAAMQKILDRCRRARFKAGDYIIREGEKGDTMYIVIDGAVEVLKRTRAGDYYTVVQLKAEHNVFIGELALVDDDTRSATIAAVEDSECLLITKKDFLDLGDRYPEIGLPITREISKILAGRLRKTTSDMLTLFDALVEEIGG